MYFSLKNVFDNLNSMLNDVDAEAEALTKSVAEDVAQTAEKINVPMNIIREEDGSYTVEVAVVGKTKENISVKGVVEDGKTFLLIDTSEKEKTEDEKTTEEKRTYTVRKIKGTGKLSIKISVPSAFDLSKAEKTIENGLLTVKIPLAEAAKPKEFDI